jgi:ATP-dependent RNA helicase DeaD
LEAANIGHIDIQDDHTLVELPSGMPRGVFLNLKKAWVCGRRLNIAKHDRHAGKKEGSRKETSGVASENKRDGNRASSNEANSREEILKRKPRKSKAEKKKIEKKQEQKKLKKRKSNAAGI